MELDGGHLDIFKVLFYALDLKGSGLFTLKSGIKYFFKVPTHFTFAKFPRFPGDEPV
jgi:hypothetical protein